MSSVPMPLAEARRVDQARWATIRLVLGSPSGMVGVALFVFFCVLAVAGEHLAPYDPVAIQYLPNGKVAQVEPPSRAFWLGTTHYGRDVLSQVIVGSRVAFIVGIVSAFFIAFIGTTAGAWAGSYGPSLDDRRCRRSAITFC